MHPSERSIKDLEKTWPGEAASQKESLKRQALKVAEDTKMLPEVMKLIDKPSHPALQDSYKELWEKHRALEKVDPERFWKIDDLMDSEFARRSLSSEETKRDRAAMAMFARHMPREVRQQFFRTTEKCFGQDHLRKLLHEVKKQTKEQEKSQGMER